MRASFQAITNPTYDPTGKTPNLEAPLKNLSIYKADGSRIDLYDALAQTLFTPDLLEEKNLDFHHIGLDHSNSFDTNLDLLRKTIENADQNGKKLLVLCGIKSNRHSFNAHAVSLIYTPETRELDYIDPQGDPMPPNIAAHLPRGITINTSTLKQQSDDYSCTYLTFHNLSRAAHDLPCEETIDIAALRQSIGKILEPLIEQDIATYPLQSETRTHMYYPASKPYGITETIVIPSQEERRKRFEKWMWTTTPNQAHPQQSPETALAL